MKPLVFLAASALLLSTSLAYADNPLIPNDNDHMQALGLAIGQTAGHRAWMAQAGGVTTATYAARRVSPAFLLSNSENDQKRVENQYAR